MDATNGVILDPDFLALGLGGTNMMAMLWTVAMGRQAVGVEMRGDPFLGVHWNIREDFYHQLGLIDQMILEQYGEARIPRRANGKLFRLAECFYSEQTSAGDIVADEVIDGFDADQHIVGTIRDVEFIDDRWRDGLPNRVITILDPPVPPSQPDAKKIRTSMIEVLDGPSTFQAEAASIQKLLRRYLELMEQQDLEHHHKPRIQLFTHHRVVQTESEGFIHCSDGRKRIRIEALQEFDFKGQFVRVREPNSQIIDLGTPELFMIAQGFKSSDAKRLGFEQHDVEVDHNDGRGAVVAQADFMAGLLEVLVGGRLRRRISSEFDEDGKEYWVRQIAVGHENDPEVGWVLVQVPDFKTFDPIVAGLVPEGTDPNSPEFFASYQHLIYDFYIEQAAQILEISPQELRKVQMIYGPTLFSLIERAGDDSLVATNGVVAGDSFGNGHFLTSGGAMTGMIGHSARVLEYWQERDRGTSPAVAIRQLADSIKEDTHAWLEVSAKEYSQAAPINFGAKRIEQISKASGIATSARSNAIDAARRQRHALIPLDPSNWRRLFVRNGKVLSILPELNASHPQRRSEEAASSFLASLKDQPFMPRAITKKLDLESEPGQGEQSIIKLKLNADPDMSEGEQTILMPTFKTSELLSDGERTILRSKPKTDELLSEGERTILRSSFERAQHIQKQLLRIGSLTPQNAQVYAVLEIEQGENIAQHMTINVAGMTIGRPDPKRGIKPDIDLTQFDTSGSVSRLHARIRLHNNRYYIEDLKSRNKTRLGELILTPLRPEILQNGDIVHFASVKATFRLLGASELPTPWAQS
ncbi:FHA domain-containing protein [Ktedonospora formicarum]|uniref:FHA domain-containing protein n=1 Tax=Ktedonospora formicarum TaxID=2778364 RepID=A0A8J3MYJ9_9CHLR|nr:FHA domain-containing protein [Ktedonospora formicarum]GHO51026.1 hypothetical protein KSX_91890 [Ktedonospora formicarum]